MFLPYKILERKALVRAESVGRLKAAENAPTRVMTVMGVELRYRRWQMVRASESH